MTTHTDDERLEGIVSNDEIIRVHGHANFGSMSPREVVNDGVRKTAAGYHCGHTQFTILREHGLTTKPRGMSYDTDLTKKGKAYACVLYHERDKLIAESRAYREALTRIFDLGSDGEHSGDRHARCRDIARAALTPSNKEARAMTDQPTPGEDLTDESVRLLLPGDVLRHTIGVPDVRYDGPYEAFDYHDRNGAHLTRDDGTNFILKDGYGPKSYWFANLTFVSRPSGGQDGGGEDWVNGTAENPVGTPVWCAWATHEIMNLRALATPAKATGWQGIETLPTDISVPFVETNGSQFAVRCLPNSIGGLPHSNPSTWGCVVQPTLWMPLLPLPEDEGVA